MTEGMAGDEAEYTGWCNTEPGAGPNMDGASGTGTSFEQTLQNLS